jgi:hypothetical protein
MHSETVDCSDMRHIEALEPWRIASSALGCNVERFRGEYQHRGEKWV